MELREIEARIGRRVRTVRRARKLPMSHIADALGITYQQMQKYETGANRISAGRLVLIACILKIPPGDLLPGIE